ncbi:hypothetical protein BJY01DRAFT_121427 [Aspergillus pseudoustus]|uniref:Ankyrin repeat-containing domain protein n=1 Tax=Aspergillus pseudoustus TaxID=1810923 RepID=A0ABR4IQP3_9EURO
MYPSPKQRKIINPPRKPKVILPNRMAASKFTPLLKNTIDTLQATQANYNCARSNSQLPATSHRAGQEVQLIHSVLETVYSQWHQDPSTSAGFPAYQDPASIDLVHVCKTGNLALVERWAEQFDPEKISQMLWTREIEGSPAIRAAVSNERFDVVKFLLYRSSNPGKHILSVIYRAYKEKKHLFLRSVLQLPDIKPVIHSKN